HNGEGPRRGVGAAAACRPHHPFAVPLRRAAEPLPQLSLHTGEFLPLVDDRRHEVAEMTGPQLHPTREKLAHGIAPDLQHVCNGSLPVAPWVEGAAGDLEHFLRCQFFGHMSPAPKLMNNPENRQSATIEPAWTRCRWVVLMPSAAAWGSASTLTLAWAWPRAAIASCSSASSFRQRSPRRAHSASRDLVTVSSRRCAKVVSAVGRCGA